MDDGTEMCCAIFETVQWGDSKESTDFSGDGCFLGLWRNSVGGPGPKAGARVNMCLPATIADATGGPLGDDLTGGVASLVVQTLLKNNLEAAGFNEADIETYYAEMK